MKAVGRNANAPLPPPLSVNAKEWSMNNNYPPGVDSPYYNNNRGNLASPPNSGGSNMSINGFSPVAGPRSTGGPSPPASVGRSSSGTNMYVRGDAAGPTSGSSISGQGSQRGGDIDESVLYEHYLALRVFLNSRDSAAKQQPNKARDKLLRLSSVQFYELSTDVFDELMRRQATARIPPNAPNRPPAFLLPEKTFHPKRNQARQRLSSLGHPRFRDLAADVFSELERRFPRFLAADIPRAGSAMSNRSPGGAGRTRTPVNGGFPRSQSNLRRPSDASSLRGGPPPPPPSDAYGIPPSPNIGNGDYNRPMPRQLQQSNAIIPNKSTMLEEDDEPGSSEADKKLIDDYESQLGVLREKLADMEEMMKKKDDQVMSALDGARNRAAVSSQEKQDWAELRLSLEDKLAQVEKQNRSIKQELDRERENYDRDTRDLQQRLAEMEENGGGGGGSMRGGGGGDLERENEELRNSLRRQQRVTEEVREEAQEFLREMRDLSEQSHARYEKQVELEQTVEQLELEVKEWRNRYARTKTQLRSLRSSSLGLSEENNESGRLIREKGFADDKGLIKDVHVTKYQIAIDELLQAARKDKPEKTMDAMKAVVLSVRRITGDTDNVGRQEDQQMQLLGKLKARVSATANNLITATKNFASGAGISPVSLIDAAASHLTVAVVELLRVCKIRPSPAGELEDEQPDATTPSMLAAAVSAADTSNFFTPRNMSKEERGGGTRKEAAKAAPTAAPAPPFRGLGGMRDSVESSAYSPINSPRESMDRYGRNGTNGMSNGYNADDYKVYGGY